MVWNLFKLSMLNFNYVFAIVPIACFMIAILTFGFGGPAAACFTVSTKKQFLCWRSSWRAEPMVRLEIIYRVIVTRAWALDGRYVSGIKADKSLNDETKENLIRVHRLYIARRKEAIKHAGCRHSSIVRQKRWNKFD